MSGYTATYSPEDNKLRLYASQRLPADVYKRVREAGFIWAPKQELFVAPMWTPSREDLCLELAGEIEDEDKSLVERAEERSDRFQDYSHNRAQDASQAKAAVDSICEGIPLGQPILVGHHSERHARKDAERIENGMRKAVAMWEQSEYWKRRAAGAIRAAKYKERPDVRARRIKKIEADARRQERFKTEAEHGLRFWHGEIQIVNKETREKRPLTICRENREWILRYLGSDPSHLSFEFPLSKYPRNLPASQYEGHMSLWSALGSDEDESHAIITIEQARDLAVAAWTRSVERCNRWLAHYANRLAYERAMLAEDGGTVAERTGPEQGGACKCWASPRGGWSYIQKVNKVSVTVLDNWGNGGRNFTRTIPFDKLVKVMTAAQVQSERDCGTLVELPDKTGFVLRGSGHDAEASRAEKAPDKAKEEFQAMKETLKAGVQVVSASNLFPTPRDLAARMADMAEMTAGDKVLEPSAGLGGIVQEAIQHGIFQADCVLVDISFDLTRALSARFPQAKVVCADFLACNGDLGKFDRILMNPPFDHGSDIKHIKHALTFLNPGGRLVAICANGPKQQSELQPLSSQWIALPGGTFEGTNVSTALIVID